MYIRKNDSATCRLSFKSGHGAVLGPVLDSRSTGGRRGHGHGLRAECLSAMAGHHPVQTERHRQEPILGGLGLSTESMIPGRLPVVVRQEPKARKMMDGAGEYVGVPGRREGVTNAAPTLHVYNKTDPSRAERLCPARVGLPNRLGARTQVAACSSPRTINHPLLLLVASSSSALKVLVTGAGGRTGKLVFQQLKESA